MNDPITNPTEAEELLRAAISPDTDPVLSEDQVSRLLDLAEVNGAWSIASLNRAAVLGWEWKAAAAAANFDAGVGTGKTFALSQVYEHCLRQASRYASGQASVAGIAAGSGASIGVLELISVAYADDEE